MKTTDIDIDVPDRKIVDEFKLPHYKASMVHNDIIKEHNCGIYFQKIPTLFNTNISTIPYDKAPEYGYFKVDILTNSVYTDIVDEEDMNRLIGTEPDWDLMRVPEHVRKLTQIHNHYDTIQKWLPNNVLQLAMLLAMIRPSKSYLIDTAKSWDSISKVIWIKPEGNVPYFKKPRNMISRYVS